MSFYLFGFMLIKFSFVAFELQLIMSEEFEFVRLQKGILVVYFRELDSTILYLDKREIKLVEDYAHEHIKPLVNSS